MYITLTTFLNVLLYKASFQKNCVALKRAVFFSLLYKSLHCLLAAGVLGDSLGTLRDSVLGQLTGQEKTDSGLDFSAGDS